MVAVIAKKRKRVARIGPADHGRAMSLDDFDRASVVEGYAYELGQGVIDVSELPDGDHADIVFEIRDAFVVYKASRPDVIATVASPSEAKVLIDGYQSERHPDVMVYFRPRPKHLKQPWSEWIPEIVVEVVSRRSVQRDYEEKPPEYLTLGVQEYWIVDPIKQVVTVKTRWRGIWKDAVLKPGKTYESRLLPGFKLDVRKVLAAGK
jgi:Uma2 family endonuclease